MNDLLLDCLEKLNLLFNVWKGVVEIYLFDRRSNN